MKEPSKILLAVAWALLIITIQRPDIQTSYVAEIVVLCLFIFLAIQSQIWLNGDAWEQIPKNVRIAVLVVSLVFFILGMYAFFYLYLHFTTFIYLIIVISIVQVSNLVLSRFCSKPTSDEQPDSKLLNDTDNITVGSDSTLNSGSKMAADTDKSAQA
ncbi:hypothetical protein I6M54_16300 [Shewanella algae]|uniref:Uncharacterized protein n=1 Tax=Shewanella algae TaxID=38313 RepID=A0AAD1KBC0_9GAMM|nr:hypothetical protein [Shewanella algae]MBO2596375.1 hypothetical protein [Shewanella algae]MBO2667732.1 hypothetical protein [Shewanella algae]BCV46229.1 hypothetical protein TUM17379_32470 [Shewanella algae]